MSDLLVQICNNKREHIARQKKKNSLNTLEREIRLMSEPRGFRQRLDRKIAAGEFALITEIKKASPSAGVIRKDFNPVGLAQGYEEGGATCLSVLTDIQYFQGCDAYLTDAREEVSLPVLRKDFIVDPYQVLESRAIGADAILLIMAAVEDKQAHEIEDLALELGMDMLVEVHNETELERAVGLKTDLIGINNRNLSSLEVDLAITETLAPKLPGSYTIVCESGIQSNEDLQRMAESNVHCFLVGESLMRQEDVTLATRNLLGDRRF